MKSDFGSIAVVIGALLLVAVGPRVPAADDTLQPMFNGRDLSGWVLTNTPPETWTFQDGMLVCSGRPIGELRTEKMYQNFVMELEWRHLVPRGNAGVFVWADDITARGVPFHRGIEVQVLENAYGNTSSHTTHGDIFPIHGATMMPLNGRGGSRAFPTENRSKPSPEWNHYRIECRDGEISLAVNGKVVTRGTDCVPRKGYICLESEGGVVNYRNVRIQELPGDEPAAEHVAIAHRGYRSIYTGLNLDGWHIDRGDGAWRSNDWVLAFGGAENDRGRLASDETFVDVGFVLDVRLKSDAAGAVITAGVGGVVDLSQPEVATHLEPAGRWNRLEGTVVGGKLHLLVNGHEVSGLKAGTADDTGAVTLQPVGPVDFCNIYVRSISDRP